jgi:hypothetical protein
MRTYLEQTHCKKGLVEWLTVQALSSNPSTEKKKIFFSQLGIEKKLSARVRV